MYSIYLISALIDETLQWKIGVSKHPEKRIKELQTANPNILGINALFEIKERNVAYKTEAMLKKRLKEFQIKGEWYSSYCLNEHLFISYCEMIEESAIALIKIKENLKKWK